MTARLASFLSLALWLSAYHTFLQYDRYSRLSQVNTQLRPNLKRPTGTTPSSPRSKSDMASRPDQQQPEEIQGLALGHSELDSGNNGRNLEEEISAPSENAFFETLQRPVGEDQTEMKITNPSEIQPCFEQQAGAWLYGWTETLKALAAAPCTEANKNQIIEHASNLFLWMQNDVLTHVRNLQTDQDHITELYHNTDADNEKLGTQIGTLRGKYADLFEAYAKEFHASREKTREMSGMMDRATVVVKEMGVLVGHGSTDVSMD